MIRRLHTFLLAALISVGLTGCNIGKQPAPEDVLADLYASLSEMQTAHYDMKLGLRGGLTTSFAANIDTAQINLSGDLVNKPGALPHYSVDADVSANGGDGSIQIGGNLISLDSYTYFQLTDLVLPTLLPVSLGADKKWYKIQTDPGDASRVGGVDTANLTPAQEGKARFLIANAKPLKVIEVLPMTTVNGQRAYHYITQVDPVELKALLDGMADISGSTKRQPDLSYLAEYKPEVFISSKDGRLLRLAATGIYLHDGLPTAFDLRLDFTNHNAKIDLGPPSASQSVDTAKLFGLPKLPF